jgi:glycyl-tRNA synthetase
MEYSNSNLTYLDTTTNEKTIPYVIEPSVGVERLLYALIVDKYEIEKLKDGESREVLRLPYLLAPYKAAVLPLATKLSDQAQVVYKTLVASGLSVTFDVSGSIGKRYRRQDAIGTPYCITFDFDSVEKQTVTIRNRDNMKQETIAINKLIDYFQKIN